VPLSKGGGRSPQPEKAFHALWERLKEHPLARLGPGLITGVADDDPSGIATYSQAGAQFGLNMLWTMPLAYPLMAAIQSMCAQIGRVTGKGLAANIKTAFPPIVLKGVVLLFLIANTLNIAADVAAMGEVAELVSGADRHLMTAFFVFVTLLLQIFCAVSPICLFPEVADAFAVGLCRGPVHRECSLGRSGAANRVAKVDVEF
jgi:Mn2+/Fe2+ NRAMP family transporter